MVHCIILNKSFNLLLCQRTNLWPHKPNRHIWQALCLMSTYCVDCFISVACYRGTVCSKAKHCAGQATSCQAVTEGKKISLTLTWRAQCSSRCTNLKQTLLSGTAELTFILWRMLQWKTHSFYDLYKYCRTICRHGFHSRICTCLLIGCPVNSLEKCNLFSSYL